MSAPRVFSHPQRNQVGWGAQVEDLAALFDQAQTLQRGAAPIVQMLSQPQSVQFLRWFCCR